MRACGEFCFVGRIGGYHPKRKESMAVEGLSQIVVRLCYLAGTVSSLPADSSRHPTDY
jgi:hypothetical protein